MLFRLFVFIYFHSLYYYILDIILFSFLQNYSRTSENVKDPTFCTHESNPTSQHSATKEQKDVTSERLQHNINQEHSKRTRNLKGSNLATGYSSDPVKNVNINDRRRTTKTIMGFFSFLTNFKTHLHAAFALRVALVLYGEHKVRER